MKVKLTLSRRVWQTAEIVVEAKTPAAAERAVDAFLNQEGINGENNRELCATHGIVWEYTPAENEAPNSEDIYVEAATAVPLGDTSA